MEEYFEKESLIKKWYYFLPIIVAFIHQSFFFLIMIPILYFISRIVFKIYIKASDNKLYYKTAILNLRGNIMFNTIESIRKIEFESRFKIGNFRFYQYCNSNSVSDVKYGVEFKLNNNKTILIPTKKPDKLISYINNKIEVTIPNRVDG